MSESEAHENEVSIEEPVVTAKDPKRVEQGKRLAAISKEAKERKMRQRIREDFSYLPWVGYGVAIVSTVGLVYKILFPTKNEVQLEKTHLEMRPPSPKPQPKNLSHSKN